MMNKNLQFDQLSTYGNLFLRPPKFMCDGKNVARGFVNTIHRNPKYLLSEVLLNKTL
jgi:hypothetical protein